MEEFCGSDFWNLSITWNATSQPDFLPCFENTVLLWIPCMFLWCLSPLETHYLIQSKDRNIPWSFFNFTKIISSIGILIAQLTLLIYNISNNSDDYIYGADFLAPSLLIITILLQMIFVIMEKKRGIQSSAYLFLFWFLMALFGAAKFRTLILGLEDGVKQENQMDFVVYMIYYPLVLIMFFLNFFADKRPKYLYHPRGEHACPEEDSSFFSRLTFSWLDRLIWRGYRKPITQEMLWDLPYINSSQKIKKDWDKHWETTMKKSLKKGESHSRATYANDSKQVYLVGTSGDKNHYVSILPTMVKTFGLQFLMGSFLKLIHDLLQFISPLIINVLIRFADTESADPEPEWRGYVYAVTLLFVTQAQSFFLGQYFVRMFLVGLKIRTAVISAVYRKALKISNSARKESTVGEIVNLMSVDAQRFMDLITYLNMIWSAPLQIGLSLYFLWEILGASVLAGLAVMIILIPINGYIANQQKRLQISQMKFKDNRVLKLYAWEPSFEEQVLNIRKKEVKVLKKAAYLNAGTSFIWTCTPFMVTFVMFLTYVLSDPLHVLTPDKVFVSITLLNIMRMPMTMFPFLLISTVQVSVATFAVYITVSGGTLDAQTAFVSITLFNLLRFPVAMLPMMITSLVQAQVSLKRMNKFINADELDPNAVSRDGSGNAPVTIENGTFSWGHSEEDKSVLKGIDVKIKEKTLVGVVGTVGAGKSSLCSAILGEMEKISGSVAYVPQQAWIQNEHWKTIFFLAKIKRLLFMKRYRRLCVEGINLSGGQKQRVSLARSVYSDAEIFLLDDPLKISEQGTYAELLEKKGEFQEFLLQYLSEGKEEEEEDLEEIKSELERTIGKQAVERQISRKHRESESSADGKSKLGGLSRSGSIKQNEEIGMAKANGPASKLTNKPGTKVGEKLIETEKSETGKVSMAVYSYYIKAIGILSAALTVFFYAASQGFAVGSNVWLSKWSEDSNSTVPSVRNKYLGVYGGLGVLQEMVTVKLNDIIYFALF
ncbi:Multidrug resistance-associated protein 1 [Armadillidium vulgare]|nr:Multidrug resistance-associated protein 1 [Armadillidium vulgare]